MRCSWCRDVGMKALRARGCAGWAPTTPYHDFGQALVFAGWQRIKKHSGFHLLRPWLTMARWEGFWQSCGTAKRRARSRSPGVGAFGVQCRTFFCIKHLVFLSRCHNSSQSSRPGGWWGGLLPGDAWRLFPTLLFSLPSLRLPSASLRSGDSPGCLPPHFQRSPSLQPKGFWGRKRG